MLLRFFKFLSIFLLSVLHAAGVFTGSMVHALYSPHRLRICMLETMKFAAYLSGVRKRPTTLKKRDSVGLLPEVLA